MGRKDDAVILPKGAGRAGDPVILPEGGTPKAAAGAAPPLEWGDVPGMALSNLGPSAARFGSDIVSMVAHPVDTAESIYNLGLGAVQKLIPDSWTGGPMGKEKYADAMGQFLVQRYGGESEIMNTVATDPVGVLADFSTFLTGGGMAAAKGAMLAGKVSKAGGVTNRIANAVQTGAQSVSKAGSVVDPLSLAGRGASLAARWPAVPVAKAVVGTLSGTGTTPISEAFKAGKTGGRPGKVFRENMRGSSSAKQILIDARSALGEMRSRRSAAYRENKKALAQDTTVLKFDEITQSVQKAIDNNTFKGVPLDEKTGAILEDIIGIVDEWKRRDPVEFHTPEGIDALKQRVGSLIDWQSMPKAQNIAVQEVYSKIGDIIRKQAPGYDAMMKEYAEASDLILEIDKSLSLGKKSTADSAIRKLTSVMRNNVNTNYGARAASVKALEDVSGANITPAIAGQSMNALTPRGLAGTGLQTAITAASALSNPWALASIPFQSPRLVGEAAHLAGRVSRAGGMPAALLGKVGATPAGVAQAGYLK
jgi:hypothetical protein